MFGPPTITQIFSRPRGEGHLAQQRIGFRSSVLTMTIPFFAVCDRKKHTPDELLVRFKARYRSSAPFPKDHGAGTTEQTHEH